MKLKDIEDRIARAVETENPPGTDYYGAEVDEDDVEAARKRMERSIETHEHAEKDSGVHPRPSGGTQKI